MDAAERPRSDVATVALIVLLGLALRAWLAWSTPLIGTDGALFVWNAERWDAEGWLAAVRFSKHPLYPCLIWLAHGVCGGYERAALALSVVLGALQAVPVFFLARRLAGRGAAISAAVLLAVHPFSCRLAGDVMTEATYYFFFLCAAWTGYLAGADRRWGAAAAAGACAGLAYLTRVEGALLAGMAGVWIVVSGLRAWRGMVLRGALLALAFAVVVFPYLLVLREATGQWLLTKKGAQIEFESYSLAESEIPDLRPRETSRIEQEVQRHGYVIAYAGHFSHEIPTVFKLYFLPLALACVFRGWADRRLNACLAIACVAWLAFFVWVLHRLSYLSSRTLLTLALLAMPWMGLGSHAFLAWLARFPRRGRTLAIVVAVAFLAGTLVATLKPQRTDQLGQRRAGEWIRDHGGGKGTVVLAVNEKPAYYSGGRLLWWPPGPYAFLRDKALLGVVFLAATEEEALAQTPDFPLAGVPGEIERVWASDDYGKGRVVVWKVARKR